MMIQRDILEEVGGFKTHLAEDFELILRLYMAGYEVLYREGISVPAECASDPWEWFFVQCLLCLPCWNSVAHSRRE